MTQALISMVMESLFQSNRSITVVDCQMNQGSNELTFALKSGIS